jgi:tripartite ATP-independent transporter DctM subunit
MGLEISIGWLTLLMFGSLLVLLMAGLPLAFVTGGLAAVFLYVLNDVQMLNMVPSRIFPLMTDYQLSAIPLFIFMAAMLERAGLIREMFDVIYKLLGGLRGGLASATIFASTLLAAMVGIIGAAVVTMGIIALPAMLTRKYDSKIAMGAIMAGGTLGILIPPSILAIIYAVVAEQSVGELFIGSVIPGLMLSGMYIAYVTIRCTLNPELGPALPLEERLGAREKLRLAGTMTAPIVLIVLVLGVIFTGIATPVEAAGLGTFGSFVVAALHRRLDWGTVSEACLTTLKATSMVLWIMFGATVFVGLYVFQGGQQFVTDALMGTGLGRWGILILMQLILIVLGMFLDWVGILLLCVPIFVPIIKDLGFDPLWFGVLYLINMQMSFLSPPFGYALFYLRGVAPPEIPMADIYKAALPFLGIQVIGLTLAMVYPSLVTWLPRLVYGSS